MVRRDTNHSRVHVAAGWQKPQNKNLSEFPWQRERREKIEKLVNQAQVFRAMREAEKLEKEHREVLRLKREREEREAKRRVTAFGSMMNAFEKIEKK